jgi:TolB-like protein
MPDLLHGLRTAVADRYTVERELGHGGMAVVFLAQDLKHHRPVAIKVLRPELAAALGADRFLREIQIAARLTHPHILSLHDSGEAAGFLFYVMPYVAGESLRDRLNREKQLPVDEALHIAVQVTSALDYAHGHDVVHRDIKPENILLAGHEVLVADFGIARAITAAGGAQLTSTGMAVGTPAYMSPEQGAGESHVDGRSDLFSLGCVLYEMLAGTPPFVGPTAQAIQARRLTDPVPPLRTVRETVPAGVEQAIVRALAKVPADRFATPLQFGEALTLGVTATRTARRISRRTVGLIGAAAAAAAAVGAVLFSRSRTPRELDANLVAVAPFDVLATATLWHEGMADVLSPKLDGAGALRTVSPRIVVSRWHSRADRGSAADLGRATGARLVVFGQVVGTEGDSVRVTASLLDVASGAIVGEEIEVRAGGDQIDLLSDSLMVGLLRELGRTRPLGAVRFASIGSTSLPALKSFLQGEQYFRRQGWDSALAYYGRAIAHDSNFALALRRFWLTQWYNGESQDSVALAYARRAGALNHGLAPRESLLVAADSQWGVLLDWRRFPEGQWAHRLRVLAILEQAARRYPDDPEVWFELGEARVHFGSELGYTFRQMLDAFDHAIAADSGFAPAYITHNIPLALSLGDTAAVRRYEAGYQALPATARGSPSIGLEPRLMDPRQARSHEMDSTLDALSGDTLRAYLDEFIRSPDATETAIQLGRRLVARKGAGRGPIDTLEARQVLAYALAYRGHLREAYALAGTDQPTFLFADLALLGVVPAETVATVLAHRLLSYRGRDVLAALPWWANRHDAASLRRSVQLGDSLARPSSMKQNHWFWRCLAGAASAYLVLARSDTADALRRFAALGDSIAYPMYVRLTEAQLLAAQGREREAAVLLQPDYLDEPVPREVFRYLVRARVAERLGQRDQAIPAYQLVASLWRNADPELQPFVAEARAALRRLSAERVEP